MMIMASLSCLLVLSDYVKGALSPPKFDSKVIEDGKRQFEILVHDTKLPHYGSCWTKAMQGLTEGCKHLTEDVQTRLALSFANCFLMRSGQPIYPCDIDMDISDCLKEVSGIAFTAYTNFFTHTHSMCYYLQSQVWQESTEDTIGRLTANSADINEQLLKFKSMQSEMLLVQNKALSKQNKLIRNMETSKDTIHKVLQDFQASTEDQKSLIFEVVDKLTNLQSLFYNEVSGFMTFLYYGIAITVCFFITSTKRTISARLPIFIVFGLTIFTEHLLHNSKLPTFLTYAKSSEEVYNEIWFLRKCSIAACAIIVTYCIMQFRDLGKLNNALLDEIKQQNLEIRTYMHQLSVSYVNQMGHSIGDHIKREVKVNLKQIGDHSVMPCLSAGKFKTPLTSRRELSFPGSTPHSVYSDYSDETDSGTPKNLSKEGSSRRRKTSKERSNLTIRSPSPYNLRSKRIVFKEVAETPEEFHKYVEQISNISRRNSVNLTVGFKNPKSQTTAELKKNITGTDLT